MADLENTHSNAESKVLGGLLADVDAQKGADILQRLIEMKAALNKKNVDSRKRDEIHDEVAGMLKDKKGVSMIDVYNFMSDYDDDKSHAALYYGFLLQFETKLLVDDLKARFKSPAINSAALGKFLSRVLDVVKRDPKMKVEMNKILYERSQEMVFYKGKPELVAKVLVSSLRGFGIQNPEVKELNFDEVQWKKKIVKGYEKEYEVSMKSEIMPNNEGRIKDLTVMLDYVTYDVFFLYSQMLKSKMDDPNFTFKCVYKYDLVKRKFEAFLKKEGFKLPSSKIAFVKASESLGNDGAFSIWLRDGAVRKQNGAIVEPYRHYDLGVSTVYENLIPVEGNDVLQSKLSFQGGNMRATSTYLFVGSDDIYKSAVMLKTGQDTIFFDQSNLNTKDVQKAIKAFEKEFGKKVVVLGMDMKTGLIRREQGMFHIDMAVTPLSDREIVVGKQQGFIELDQWAEDLKAQGFKVIRIPFYMVDGGVQNSAKDYFTYNNVLLEQVNGKKRVYLPQYFEWGNKGEKLYTYNGLDLAAANLEALKVYERQRFEVVKIDVPVSMASHRGILNCVTFEGR